jgi:hypothetical protein
VVPYISLALAQTAEPITINVHLVSSSEPLRSAYAAAGANSKETNAP